MPKDEYEILGKFQNTLQYFDITDVNDTFTIENKIIIHEGCIIFVLADGICDFVQQCYCVVLYCTLTRTVLNSWINNFTLMTYSQFN